MTMRSVASEGAWRGAYGWISVVPVLCLFVAVRLHLGARGAALAVSGAYFAASLCVPALRQRLWRSLAVSVGLAAIVGWAW